jgi:hypothetical protein
MNRWSNVVVNTATILLVALLLIPTVALGQRLDGDLRGVVKDPTGAVIPEAAVTITNQDTGEVRNLKTTRAGVYFASNLLPGSYMIRVEVSGFRTVERTSVVVISNRIVEANFSLEVGPTVEVVTVEEGAELVTTQSSTLVGVSHSKYELSGPGSMGAIAGANAGNPIALAAYAPGTTTQPGGMAGQGGSIGGNRPRMNSFTVDGLDNNDPSVTGQNGPVLAEAIREFTLITNQFAAEYGHSTAAQFVVTTDAGTNEIHGKGWWYHQNRNYNAFDNLTRAATPPGEDKPRYDVNRFGGAAGGSIVKGRALPAGGSRCQPMQA